VAKTGGVAVAFQVGPQSGEFTDLAPTLDCRAKNGPIQNQLGAGVPTAMQVRRLTPVECEQLQGFPDNYTQIPWRKKPAGECPDGPRYKALGNSWAVPVVRWIGKRIDNYIKEQL
jgi:DNA (cytosine-5)-methyltransferase 1